jgi:hypothetical protein
MSALLTPEEVAEYLKKSLRTVYANREKLGGFYPLGLKVLRVDPEVIYGSVLRPGEGIVAVRVPVLGRKVHGKRQDQGGSPNRKRGAPKKGQGEGQDPGADANRHGLFDGC